MAQVIKNLPAVQETWVRSLGQEDPLEERAWQLTPVFLPGESHGQRRLEGHSPWGCKDLDTTELMLSHLDKLTSRDGFLNACPVLNFEFFLMTNPRMSLEDVPYRASDLLNTSVHHFGFSGCYGKWPQRGQHFFIISVQSLSRV